MLALEDEGRLDEAKALAHASVREQLTDALRHMVRSDSAGSGDVGNALIIDGKALDHALDDDLRDSLLAVSTLAFSASCPISLFSLPLLL